MRRVQAASSSSRTRSGLCRWRGSHRTWFRRSSMSPAPGAACSRRSSRALYGH
ncbi:DUF2550 family protein [Subtercola sp. PAMC28395]|nr:DUF2550 family protein [Subtercola sp. PAMC28395]